MVGSAFGVVLIVIGWKANRDINILVLNMLAILTGLNAVLDLFFLIGNSSAALGDVRNDAAVFSEQVFPLIPGAVWAFLWALLAVAILGISIWYSVIRPMRQR